VRKGDHFQACALYGLRNPLPYMSAHDETQDFGRMTAPEEFFTPEQMAVIRDDDRCTDPWRLWNTWIDGNDDGVIQPEELTIEKRNWQDPVYLITGIGEDMALLGTGWGPATVVYRVPVDHFTENGVPVYPHWSQVQPLLRLIGATDYAPWPDDKRGRIYTVEHKGGDRRRRGEWAAVVC